MIKKKQKIIIGVDLDGVIIDKPPFVPRGLMEWLYKSHTNRKLGYRYPGRLEQCVRWASHYPYLRPPIEENLAIIKKLSKDEKYKLVAISSRYSFLEGRTKQWRKTYKVNGIFSKVYVNLENEQPHLFKKRMIKKLGVKIFIEDDEALIGFLKRNIDSVKIVNVSCGNQGLRKLLKK